MKEAEKMAEQLLATAFRTSIANALTLLDAMQGMPIDDRWKVMRETALLAYDSSEPPQARTGARIIVIEFFTHQGDLDAVRACLRRTLAASTTEASTSEH